jgi:2'-5' RNA ligase
MVDSIRTFVAAELTEPFREKVADIQTGLAAKRLNIRWVRPENVHLTLVFLGDIHPRVLDDIHQAVTETARRFAPIHLTAGGLGVFPGIRRPRVVFLGLTGEIEPLRRLRASLSSALEKVPALDYRVEKRPFKAHLTLGRVKGRIDSRKLAIAMDGLQKIPAAPLTIDTIHVFKSDLRPSGAIYTKLKKGGYGE